MPRNYDEHENSDPSKFFSSVNQQKDPKKPCRTCTDFKTWMKLGGKTQNKKAESKAELSEEQIERAERESKSCPVDSNELGRAGWTILHTISANLDEKSEIKGEKRKDLTQFLTLWGKFYPCEPCAEDFRADLKVNPPKFTSGLAFSTWLCEAHNRVNRKMGKAEFDCGKTYERWRDGWKDGSCD